MRVIPEFMDPDVQISNEKKKTNTYNDNDNEIKYKNSGNDISIPPNLIPEKKRYSNPNPNPNPNPHTEPLLNIQLYEPKKQNPMAVKKPFVAAEPDYYPYIMAPTGIAPQLSNYIANSMKHLYTPQIYQQYTLNFGGPNGDIARAKRIFEDALPPPEVFTSYKTLRERNGLCNYIRSNFINIEDGELTDWTGSGSTSLASRLKITAINHYKTNRYSTEPITSNTKKMLFYKSCYPIVNDKNSSSVQCNKNFIGINIRVYDISLPELIIKYYDKNFILNEFIKYNNNLAKLLTDDDENFKNIVDNEKPENYDIWRDLKYYEFIKNKINKTYMCPNFVQSYCYFLDRETKYDFNKLKNFDPESNTKPAFNTNFTGGTIVLLTESPADNIYQWASNSGIKTSNIVTSMKTSGYKIESHWKSVISQMLIVFYVMWKKKFTIADMSVKSNFYVANLNVQVDSKPYWLYNINGVDYYIPNFGHLLMVDHDFKDLDVSESSKKILSEELFEDDENNIYNAIISNAKNCFDSGNFKSSNGEFKGIGGIEPDSNVIDLMNKINEMFNDIQSKFDKNSLEKIVDHFLKNYVHNRVGTLIRELEFKYINRENSDFTKFKRGDLLLHQKTDNEFVIVLCLGKVIDSSFSTQPMVKFNCLTKKSANSNEYIEQEILFSDLYSYSEYDTIKQDFKLGESYADTDYIIEKYYL